MSALSVITTNNQKFLTAQKICEQFNIALKQVSEHDIDEIQGEDATKIIARKAADAFTLIQEPLVVTDDSWIIPGLGGFPGAYMKSLSSWFTIHDWERLLRTLSDRQVILRQMVAYQDADDQAIFAVDLKGTLLTTPQGVHQKSPVMAMVSFDGGVSSVAENFAAGNPSTLHMDTAWHQLAPWIQEHKPHFIN